MKTGWTKALVKAVPGIYAINRRGVRIGTVMHIRGEPVATRWWGYSIHRDNPNVEKKAGHRTRREAAAWVILQDMNATEVADENVEPREPLMHEGNAPRETVVSELEGNGK